MLMQQTHTCRSRAGICISSVPAARRTVQGLPGSHRLGRRNLAVRSEFAPPTVADTKRKFVEAYRKPVPAVYNNVLQELLVQQHFIRWSVKYQYDEVSALGFVSVFDQLLDDFTEADKDKLFDAYVLALGEDPHKVRADAEALEAQARQLSGPDALNPEPGGDVVQAALAQVADAAASGAFSYTLFVAVGIFRLLELTGGREPASLSRLVARLNLSPDAVNKDLLLYKGTLSKMASAKALMREVLQREKKKAAEREAAREAAKQGAVAASGGDGAALQA